MIFIYIAGLNDIVHYALIIDKKYMSYYSKLKMNMKIKFRLTRDVNIKFMRKLFV